MSDKLVAYFSASGVTEAVAKKLAAAAGADLFEIEASPHYTDADLNWMDKKSRSTVEMNNETCRPTMAQNTPDVSGYSTVFVGFPVWWYVEPRIIDTFLESADFAGKAIVPFATSGGSGLGKAPERMAAIAKGSTVLTGKMLNGNPSEAELKNWIAELGV